MNILLAPFVNALFGFYYLVGNLGWSVVLVTVVIRLILMPLVVPSLKSAKKMNELQPKLKKLQQQYGKEKEKLAKAQMDLYKAEGINPLSGCLPQLLQVAVLIIFFSAFNMVTNYSMGKGKLEDINRQLIPSFQIKSDFKFSTDFMGSQLSATPSKIFSKGIGLDLLLPVVLLLGSAGLQYFSSKLMMPDPKLDKEVVAATKEKGDDMMEAMRTQSLYMMPLMTVVIGWSFSLGILLYWFVNSAVMLGQQLVVGRIQKKS
jgi:YidC/Oxa1 family membrane protein insertase